MTNVKKIILKKYDYELGAHKICQNERPKNKVILPSFIIFLLILGLYFFQEQIFNKVVFDFLVVAFAAFAFILIPFGMKKGNRFQMLMITPDALIQRNSKKNIVLIPYEKIKKCKVDEKRNVILESGHLTIILEPKRIGSDLSIIIDILEAYGKTFDKNRDFLIRPVIIEILNGEVTIVDQKVEETETERLVGKYSKMYPMLTPGFLDLIIIDNSVVERAIKVDNNLVLKINVIEIKEGHPENTKFESQVAEDCIIIFEAVDIEKIIRKDAENKEESKEISITLGTLVKKLSKSVISNWHLEDGVISMQFSIGVSILHVTMGYKEVVVGWKDFK